MRHQLLPGMNQQAAMFASLEEDEFSALTSVSELSPSPLTSVLVPEYVHRASAPLEFTRHQLLPGVNQQAAVSRPLPASAGHSVYNTADSCLNNITLSTSSLHGMHTVTAYSFNDVAQEELKQAPDRNESSSPLDFIESSIHPLPPSDWTRLYNLL